MLEAGDRQLGDLACRQPDADVDDPVLLAAGDGVAGEDDDRLVLRRRRHRRDGAGADLVDLHRAAGHGLLEEEVRRRRGRRALGGGRRLERDEHEPVALHGDLRAEAGEGSAQRVARGLYLGRSGERASVCGVVHGQHRGGRSCQLGWHEPTQRDAQFPRPGPHSLPATWAATRPR